MGDSAANAAAGKEKVGDCLDDWPLSIYRFCSMSRPIPHYNDSPPQVASEDIIDIGNGRYAIFRRDRRLAQVQVTFTAPEGVDPNPDHELICQFQELDWTLRGKEPGEPLIYPLEPSSPHDPAGRGDSHDVLHEQFLIIINEYREKHGMLPTLDWRSKSPNADGPAITRNAVPGQTAGISEEPRLPFLKEETRAGRPAPGMLYAFASVGADRFDLTFTDIAGDKVGFRGNQPLETLRLDLPDLLRQSDDRQHNLIVRPRSSGSKLIQLDDLDQNAAEQLRPVSFLILNTSVGNYQAWIAVADADADFARRLRKGSGADLTASGATRVSGSLNFKEKYAPAFPRVETVHAAPGRIVMRSDLEALGIVAPPEQVTPPARVSHSRSGKAFPNYQRCVENAPPARDGNRPDISRADFTFALLAIDWGRSIEETAARLMQESSKAKENGEAYALRTAQNAAAAIERRGERKR